MGHDYMLHVLRNPYNKTEEEIRKAANDAADLIESLERAVSRFRERCDESEGTK